MAICGICGVNKTAATYQKIDLQNQFKTPTLPLEGNSKAAKADELALITLKETPPRPEPKAIEIPISLTATTKPTESATFDEGTMKVGYDLNANADNQEEPLAFIPAKPSVLSSIKDKVTSEVTKTYTHYKEDSAKKLGKLALLGSITILGAKAGVVAGTSLLSAIDKHLHPVPPPAPWYHVADYSLSDRTLALTGGLLLTFGLCALYSRKDKFKTGGPA